VNNDFAKTSHNALFVAHFIRPNASHIINIETDQAKFAHHRQTHAHPPSHGLIPQPDLRSLDAPQFMLCHMASELTKYIVQM
jgi:hypothetical protein